MVAAKVAQRTDKVRASALSIHEWACQRQFFANVAQPADIAVVTRQVLSCWASSGKKSDNTAQFRRAVQLFRSRTEAATTICPLVNSGRPGWSYAVEARCGRGDAKLRTLGGS